MKQATTVLLVLLCAACLSLQAGDLEPPGDPEPTMVTLQEIYDRVSVGPVGIAKTGQTGCWDDAGNPIACSGTGQDGDYQIGTSVDPRFTDNSNGTIRDNLTGLIWLQDVNCTAFFAGDSTGDNSRNWTEALAAANSLAATYCGLSDGSVAGDWRLPNVTELDSLIDHGESDPALPTGHPFSGAQQSYYWSSTTIMRDPWRHAAWVVFLYYGGVFDAHKDSTSHVWPVRGGQ